MLKNIKLRFLILLFPVWSYAQIPDKDLGEMAEILDMVEGEWLYNYSTIDSTEENRRAIIIDSLEVDSYHMNLKYEADGESAYLGMYFWRKYQVWAWKNAKAYIGYSENGPVLTYIPVINFEGYMGFMYDLLIKEE